MNKDHIFLNEHRTLSVSDATHAEIKAKLKALDYDTSILNDALDLRGLSLKKCRPEPLPLHHRYPDRNTPCWDDPNLREEDRGGMRLRSAIMLKIEEHIANEKWDYDEVQRQFIMNDHKLRCFQKGPRHFTLDGLMEILSILNIRLVPSFVNVE